MLAITVTMVAVATPLVLSQSGTVVDTQPDIDVAFAYTEDVDTSDEDVFGETGTDVGADGLLTIVVESGESIPPGQLNITGETSSGNLVIDGTFDDDDRVAGGTQLTVWASRGDTVQLIWQSSDGDESAILDEFTVRPAP